MKKLIFLIIAVLSLSAFKCGKVENPPVPVPDKWSFKVKTPRGVTVRANVNVPYLALQDIDTGIATQIRAYNAINPFWTQYNSIEKYVVEFVEPMATNLDGSPALIHRAGVQTAGTTYGTGWDGNDTPTIVLPHQAATNWNYREYLRTSARFESEHIREWTEDKDVFNRFTGANDCHPHAAETPEENYCGY
jgi:hypothetical protein